MTQNCGVYVPGRWTRSASPLQQGAVPRGPWEVGVGGSFRKWMGRVGGGAEARCRALFTSSPPEFKTFLPQSHSPGVWLLRSFLLTLQRNFQGLGIWPGCLDSFSRDPAKGTESRQTPGPTREQLRLEAGRGVLRHVPPPVRVFPKTGRKVEYRELGFIIVLLESQI